MRILKNFFCLFLILLACNTKDKSLESRVEALEKKAAKDEAAKAPVNPSILGSEKDKDAIAEIEFTEKSFDFGTIIQGEKVKHTFLFKNKGKIPLLIQNASASCGCTIPDWPHHPIGPGEGGQIEVQFDSKGKNGPQHKTISITANTEPQYTVLTLTGMVSLEKKSNE